MFGHVERLDHGTFADVAEQRDLGALALRDLCLRAAKQDVRLDADGAQLLHRMLRRLGLKLARRLDVGQQGQVDEDRMAARQLVAELADGLEKRQPLDVADGAADFDQDEIRALVAAENELLDGVGDVRHHLHRAAQIVAAPLGREHVLIDAPRGDVVVPPSRDAGEAFVMAEIEIGLGAVVGYEHLAVLVGAHRAWIDIEIRVELAQPHRIAPCFQQRAKRRRCQALAQ